MRVRTPQPRVTRLLAVIACAALVLVALLDGVTAMTVPITWAVCLVVPGDLLRRALRPKWGPPLVECIGLDLIGSCALLAVFGGILGAVGSLGRAEVVTIGALGLAALAFVAVRRGGARVRVGISVRALSVVVLLGALGLCLFHIEPLIGDRIFLGQLRSSVEVLQAGKIPSTSWTFGADTPFPFNYLFFNVMFAVIAQVGGYDSWTTWKLLSGSLRLLQLGFFVIAWYLVGRELLRRFRPGYVTEVCAALLPALLLMNLGLRNKFRDPVVEGFGIALVGVAVWAVLRSTTALRSDRRWYTAIAVLVLSLTVGIHLPVFMEGVVLVASWLLVAPRSRQVVSGASPFAGRLRFLVRRALLFGIGVGAAFVILGILSGTTPLSPGSEPVPNDLAFRAYLFYVGNPLSPASLADYVVSRWSSVFILTTSPFAIVSIVLVAVAGLGLVYALKRDRTVGRFVLWWMIAAAFTALYVGVGFYFGRTEVTPWNAITRNAFYLWFPIAFAVTFGIRAAFAWLEGRRTDVKPFPGRSRRTTRLRRSKARPVLVLVLVITLTIAVCWPFVKALGPTVRDHGWIQASQMTADGEESLRWIDRHAPRNAVVMTTEVTFGSDIVSGRRMVTEGYATLESKPVATIAVRSLGLATDYFLPTHSPQIVIDQHVDYIVLAWVGPYAPGHLGGLPLLTSYWPAVAAYGPQLALDHEPYLHVVHRKGAIVVYQVDHDKLPSLTVHHYQQGQVPSPCTTDVCIDYQPPATGACPNEALSSEPNVCITRRTRSTGGQ